MKRHSITHSLYDLYKAIRIQQEFLLTILVIMYSSSSKGMQLNVTHLLTGKYNDLSKPLMGGPQDIGFTESYITSGGIHDHPFAFFHNGYLGMNQSDVKFWDVGRYDMPMGISEIKRQNQMGIDGGEGDPNWDSSAYNQILVNKTAEFIDSHMSNRPDDSMFMYVALGAVHTPHTPPYKYMNGVKVAGTHPTRHMDMLKETDLVVGSLVSTIEDRGLGMLRMTRELKVRRMLLSFDESNCQ